MENVEKKTKVFDVFIFYSRPFSCSVTKFNVNSASCYRTSLFLLQPKSFICAFNFLCLISVSVYCSSYLFRFRCIDICVPGHLSLKKMS